MGDHLPKSLDVPLFVIRPFLPLSPFLLLTSDFLLQTFHLLLSSFYLLPSLLYLLKQRSSLFPDSHLRCGNWVVLPLLAVAYEGIT